MSALEGIGLIVLLLLGAAFYLFRRIPLYNLMSLAILAGYGCLTRAYISTDLQGWIVLSIALLLDWFGLLVVRVMLTRSVSLQLLSTLSATQAAAGIREEMATRFHDARMFRLVHANGQTYRLSAFGWFISTIVAILYALLRIKR